MAAFSPERWEGRCSRHFRNNGDRAEFPSAGIVIRLDRYGTSTVDDDGNGPLPPLPALVQNVKGKNGKWHSGGWGGVG